MKVFVGHGPNFDLLHLRDARLYGGMRLADLEKKIADYASTLAMEVSFFQTNSEARFLEKLTAVKADAMILNPGAWTHTSLALRDRLEIVRCPIVEVHLSLLADRESFRQINLIREVVEMSFEGEHEKSYYRALDYLKK